MAEGDAPCRSCELVAVLGRPDPVYRRSRKHGGNDAADISASHDISRNDHAAAGAGNCVIGHANADRRIDHQVAGNDQIASAGIDAGLDANTGCVLDQIARDDTVLFDHDAIADRRGRRVAGIRYRVVEDRADPVALDNHASRSAIAELTRIRDVDAVANRVERVVRDDRASQINAGTRRFDEDGNFPRVEDAVVRDNELSATIAADGRVFRVENFVVGDGHANCPKCADAIAVLACPTRCGLDTIDRVAGDRRAVAGQSITPDRDAIIRHRGQSVAQRADLGVLAPDSDGVRCKAVCPDQRLGITCDIETDAGRVDDAAVLECNILSPASHCDQSRSLGYIVGERTILAVENQPIEPDIALPFNSQENVGSVKSERNRSGDGSRLKWLAATIGCQNSSRTRIVIPGLEKQRPALIAREIENGLQRRERRPAGRGGSSSSDDDIVKEGVGRHVQSPFV